VLGRGAETRSRGLVLTRLPRSGGEWGEKAPPAAGDAHGRRPRFRVFGHWPTRVSITVGFVRKSV
jgi:hypothetical protein